MIRSVVALVALSSAAQADPLPAFDQGAGFAFRQVLMLPPAAFVEQAGVTYHCKLDENAQALVLSECRPVVTKDRQAQAVAFEADRAEVVARQAEELAIVQAEQDRALIERAAQNLAMARQKLDAMTQADLNAAVRASFAEMAMRFGNACVLRKQDVPRPQSERILWLQLAQGAGMTEDEAEQFLLAFGVESLRPDLDDAARRLTASGDEAAQQMVYTYLYEDRYALSTAYYDLDELMMQAEKSALADASFARLDKAQDTLTVLEGCK